MQGDFWPGFSLQYGFEQIIRGIARIDDKWISDTRITKIPEGALRGLVRALAQMAAYYVIHITIILIRSHSFLLQRDGFVSQKTQPWHNIEYPWLSTAIILWKYVNWNGWKNNDRFVWKLKRTFHCTINDSSFEICENIWALAKQHWTFDRVSELDSYLGQQERSRTLHPCEESNPSLRRTHAWHNVIASQLFPIKPVPCPLVSRKW